ncbi:MAG: 50S ribosomal protein L29 [Planctomycetota bacterium]
MANLIELREMSDEQLELTAKEAAENLFRLRVQAQTEKLDSPSELRRNRRLIARIKTLQTEREIAAKKTETATA